MATVTRRRRSEPEDEETREERPSRRRSRDEDEERPTRRRSRDADEDSNDEEEERPRRGRRSSEDEDERPRRGGSRRRSRDSDEDEGGSRRRSSRASGGFSSYAQKKAKTSNFATDFKPGANEPTLIKFLDAEPFDNFVQHWIDDLPKGTRKSYVCRDDEYFDDEDGCPLCDIGEPGRTFSLFNVLDLTNPRKPEVKVWTASPAVADKLQRASQNERTSPLDREDVYFEVEMVKTKNKTEWTIAPVKARDLADDFDIDPFTEDELEDFKEKRYDDRKAVTKVDSYDDLMDLAESLD